MGSRVVGTLYASTSCEGDKPHGTLCHMTFKVWWRILQRVPQGQLTVLKTFLCAPWAPCMIGPRKFLGLLPREKSSQRVTP